jgi:N-acetyl-gamma-glutamyl-phosphate reductase
MSERHKIGIFGDTGMVGMELARLLSAHGAAEVAYRRNSRRAEGSLAGCRLCFLATKDAESMAFAREAIGAGASVVDMSGAFRLPAALFEKWYGMEHTAPDLLAEAVYGMPALFADRIRGARLVANPGCYPTSVILPLRPLKGLLSGDVSVVSTSGNSGARREVERESNEVAYAYGKLHKHVPEMNIYAGFDIDFTPIVIRSVFRGINTNIRAELSGELKAMSPDSAAEALERRLSGAYAPDDLVSVVRDTKERQWGTADANNTNRLIVKVRVDGGRAYICSMLDNLVKGAAGQAIENMNIMLGLPRLQGLEGLQGAGGAQELESVGRPNGSQ